MAIIFMPSFPEISFEDGIGINNSASVANGIDEIARSFRNFSEPLRESVTAVLIPSIRENFDSEGRPPWQRLAESTVERRGNGGPILNDTGTLRSEATSLSNWNIGIEEATMSGVSVEYGTFHQEGTRNMPARPFVEIQPEDEERIVTIFGEWVDRKIAEGGFH